MRLLNVTMVMVSYLVINAPNLAVADAQKYWISEDNAEKHFLSQVFM